MPELFVVRLEKMMKSFFAWQPTCKYWECCTNRKQRKFLTVVALISVCVGYNKYTVSTNKNTIWIESIWKLQGIIILKNCLTRQADEFSRKKCWEITSDRTIWWVMWTVTTEEFCLFVKFALWMWIIIVIIWIMNANSGYKQ